MDNNIYLYIPRDEILNYKARNHRGDNFRTVYYYKDKRRYKFNEKTINEVDIYCVKNIQKDTFYKNSFKSTNDKYFDWYYCLKEDYNQCESIYIKNEKSYTKSREKEYTKNRKKKQNDLSKKGVEIKYPINGQRKFVVTFD